MRKLWGGAFDGSGEGLADAFGQSISSDLTFWREDVLGSIAHARMLGSQGILAQEDADAIAQGLARILEEGPESLPQDVEDIHTAVESRLHELIGESAGRLHTGRSRNDQVATDGRLWMRRALCGLLPEVKSLQAAFLDLAEKNQNTLLPGVTHQQHAQPITLAFHFSAYFWMLQRHGRRIEHLLELSCGCPLGSAALAGTPFRIDRTETAWDLGFAYPSPHALEATTDRSLFLDALHLCSLVMIDLSRFSQELVLWSTPEYGWVKLPHALTTGSSIMPQKRNADMAELIRGRTGRVLGHWTGLAATMKGLILGYNRDTQEDKPPLFDSVALTRDSLTLARLMAEGLEVRSDRMRASLQRDFSTATDLADLLAESGIPFRHAHEITGRVVQWCEELNLGLEDLTPETLREAVPETPPGWEERILAALQPEGSVARRTSFGGSAPIRVAEQLARARYLLGESGFEAQN
jgi:argininosuccinate lyase